MRVRITERDHVGVHAGAAVRARGHNVLELKVVAADVPGTRACKRCNAAFCCRHLEVRQALLESAGAVLG